MGINRQQGGRNDTWACLVARGKSEV